MAFRHVLYDLWVAQPEVLERTGPLERLLVEAARRAGATVIHSHFHQFDPHGVTGVVLISQSHFTIHTWSEHCYAAIDFFTYSHMDPDVALDYLREQLCPVREQVTDLTRGGEPEIAPD